MSLKVNVRIFRNPWSGIIDDLALLDILRFAATDAAGEIENMIENKKVAPSDDSFAVVLLDPTRPRWARTLTERVYALLLIGSNSEEFVTFAAAKADAHDRHGVDTGKLIESASHRLGNGDCAWASSAEYNGAIGGGSGLLEDQDRRLTYKILVTMVDTVRSRRDRYVEERRRTGDLGWYNLDNEPDPEYTGLLELTPILSTAG